MRKPGAADALNERNPDGRVRTARGHVPVKYASLTGPGYSIESV